MRTTRSLLIVVATLPISWSAAADDVTPPAIELVLKRGPQWPLSSVSFSPDGRFLLTTGAGGGFFLAEAITGAEVWRMDPSRGRYFSADATEDNRLIALAKNAEVEIWDAQEQVKTRSVSIAGDNPRARISLDGRYLVAWSPSEAVAWDLTDDRHLMSVTRFNEGPYDPDPIVKAALSPDGRFFTVATSKRLSTYLAADMRLLWQTSEGESDITYSQDGKWLHVLGRGMMIIRDPVTGLDAKAWTPGHEFRIGRFTGDGAVVFGQASLGKSARPLAWSVEETAVQLWPTTFRMGDDPIVLPKPAEPAGHDIQLGLCAISRDGELFAMVGLSSIFVWNLRTCTISDAVNGVVAIPERVAIHPAGQWVTVSGRLGAGALLSLGEEDDGNFESVWRTDFLTYARDGQLLGVNSLGTVEVRAPDGSRVITSCDASVRCGGILEFFLQPRKSFDCFQSEYTQASFATDASRAVFTRAGNLYIDLVDLKRCKTIRRITTESMFNFEAESSSAISLSSKGTYIGVIGEQGNLRMVKSNASNWGKPLPVGKVGAVTFSPDERIAAAGTQDGAVVVFTPVTAAATARWNNGSAAVTSILFSPDGHSLMTGDAAGVIRVWSTRNNPTLTMTLAGHAEAVTSLSLTADGGTLVSSSTDGTVRLWDLQKQAWIATIVIFRGGTWAVFDGKWRFDTNDFDSLRDGVHWRRRGVLRQLPMEAFMRDLYFPRLLARSMAREEFPPVTPPLSRNAVQPEVVFERVVPSGAPNAIDITLRVRNVTERGTDGVNVDSGAADLSVFRDGVLVATIADPLDPRGRHPVTGDFIVNVRDVQIPATKPNPRIRLSAYAFNSVRVKSKTATFVYTHSEAVVPRRRRAYVVTAGVGAADEPTWNLWFAVKSATSVQSALVDAVRAAGYEPFTIPLLSEIGVAAQRQRNARKEDFAAVFALLGGRNVDAAIRQRIDPAQRIERATPDDIVIVYAVTHGWADRDGIFYIVPQNIGDDIFVDEATLGACSVPECRTFLSRAISTTELRNWLLDVDAGGIALILDSCFSGAVAGRTFRPAPLGDRSFGQLSYDKRMLILTATQASGQAVGSLKDGRTVLAQALLAARQEAMQGLRAWLVSARRHARTDPTAQDVAQAPQLFDFASRPRLAAPPPPGF